MKKILIVLATPLLTGCLSSGIVRVGNGQYMLSDSAPTIFSSSRAEMESKVFEEAENFCSQNGKSIHVIQSNGIGPAFGQTAEGTIRFSCE